MHCFWKSASNHSWLSVSQVNKSSLVWESCAFMEAASPPREALTAVPHHRIDTHNETGRQLNKLFFFFFKKQNKIRTAVKNKHQTHPGQKQMKQCSASLQHHLLANRLWRSHPSRVSSNLEVEHTGLWQVTDHSWWKRDWVIENREPCMFDPKAATHQCLFV